MWCAVSQRDTLEYVLRELAAVPPDISVVVLLNFKDLTGPGCIELSEVEAAVRGVA